MAYTPTVWKNGEFPPIDAEHLNKIEQGIANSAPGGFGLGGAAKMLTEADNVDNIRVSGWYTWNWTPTKQPAGLPDEAKYHVGVMRVDNGDAISSVAQTIYFPKASNNVNAGDQCVIQRIGVSSNVWNPWEWVNPPMLLGTEYRTTERYLGKLVYVKTINMGNLPGNAVKQASFQSNNVVDKIVSVTGQCTTDSGVNLSLPCHAGSGPNWNTVVLIDATGAGAAQIVTFAEDFAGYTDACITVKYTKLAD